MPKDLKRKYWKNRYWKWLNPFKVIARIYSYLTPRNRYNITLSDDQKYVWFRIAKNGTRTMLAILKENTKVSKDGELILFNKNKYKEYFKFVIIRNPWDRLVSCYENKVVEKRKFPSCWDKDFSHFVDYVASKNIEKCNKHFRLQTKLFPVDQVDYIGKFENFKEEFEYITDKIGISKPELIQKNKTVRKKYIDYYDDRTKEIVSKIYKPDIDLGGYKFGE